MAEEKARDPTMPERKPVNIPLSKIHDLPGSVFAPPSPKSLEALTSSIVLKGIQEPVILRQREDGEFQIVSGNRRRKASELAKKTEIPAFVYDMTEKEARDFRLKDNAQGKPPGKLLTEAEIGKKKDTKAVSVDKPDVKVAKDTQQDASVLPKAAGKELPKKPPAKAQEPPRGQPKSEKTTSAPVPSPISAYKDVSQSAWYYPDIQKAVWMGTYEGQSSTVMAPEKPITRQEIMTVVARALYLDLDRYPEDFDLDAKKLWDSAQDPNMENRAFYWMSRPHGTWCVREREVFLDDTNANCIWTYYADQPEGILDFRVVVEGVRDGKLAGRVYPIDYKSQVQRVLRSALPIETLQYVSEDGCTHEVDYNSFMQSRIAYDQTIRAVRYLPKSEAELQRLLMMEHRMERPSKKTRRTKAAAPQR